MLSLVSDVACERFRRGSFIRIEFLAGERIAYPARCPPIVLIHRGLISHVIDDAFGRMLIILERRLDSPVQPLDIILHVSVYTYPRRKLYDVRTSCCLRIFKLLELQEHSLFARVAAEAQLAHARLDVDGAETHGFSCAVGTAGCRCRDGCGLYAVLAPALDEVASRKRRGGLAPRTCARPAS